MNGTFGGELGLRREEKCLRLFGCSGDVDFRSIGKGVPMERSGTADLGDADPCFGALGTRFERAFSGGISAVAGKRQ